MKEVKGNDNSQEEGDKERPGRVKRQLRCGEQSKELTTACSTQWRMSLKGTRALAKRMKDRLVTTTDKGKEVIAKSTEDLACLYRAKPASLYIAYRTSKDNQAETETHRRE